MLPLKTAYFGTIVKQTLDCRMMTASHTNVGAGAGVAAQARVRADAAPA